jgi:hypothetical protein
MRFEILTAIIITLLLKSWVLALCGFEVRCRRFGETCCLHIQGPKCQGREIEVLYRTWRARADGREPIRGSEYGKGMWTNRAPSGLVGSGVREQLVPSLASYMHRQSHPIYLITLILPGDMWKWWASSSCNFIQILLVSFLLGTKFSSEHCSQTLNSAFLS